MHTSAELGVPGGSANVKSCFFDVSLNRIRRLCPGVSGYIRSTKLRASFRSADMSTGMSVSSPFSSCDPAMVRNQIKPTDNA